MQGLGSLGYVSSLNSTIEGLGTLGYISSLSGQVNQITLNSSLEGLGTLGYVSSLNSTIEGLGTLGYLSSINIIQTTLTSSIQGLGTLGYVSSLNSTIEGLGSLGYLSSLDTIQASVNSTIGGLGSLGYASTSYVTNQISSFSTAIQSLFGNSFSGSTINLSSGQVTLSSLVFLDTLDNTPSNLYVTSNLLYYGNNVIGGASVLTPQIFTF